MSSAAMRPENTLFPPMTEPPTVTLATVPGEPAFWKRTSASRTSPSTFTGPAGPRIWLLRLPPVSCVRPPKTPRLPTVRLLNGATASPSPTSICPRSPPMVTLPRSVKAALIAPTFTLPSPPPARLAVRLTSAPSNSAARFSARSCARLSVVLFASSWKLAASSVPALTFKVTRSPSTSVHVADFPFAAMVGFTNAPLGPP